MADGMVSVVIPTLNRNDVLRGTIDYFLTRESFRPLEVIVVDQSAAHDEATTRYLDSVASRIRYRRVGYQSLPRARNEGLSLALGEIVLFVDDDVQPQAGFVAAHIAPYDDPVVWMVTGPSPRPGQPLLRRDQLSEREHAKLLAGHNMSIHVDFDYAPCDWAAGCNFSVRKAAALQVGGFDENFQGNAVGEDAEFSHRIKAAGGVIYYARQAALVHLVSDTGGSRTAVGATYVEMSAYNQNYCLRAVGSGLGTRLHGIWRSYRELVLNRRNIGRPALHWAFLRGIRRGLLQPLGRPQRQPS
ncbi:Glycosyltransferase, GT2 family [Enhydrobacter aerosaccus]|uniref:Glycosyltransferase, GT2 family n=1 Tax=Enhydrobacter aerosaccus TaxID=225324 RepID=A0A1T4JQE1_9HYPH|nr:glycosyltransferase [Enhydrobacter aerosaccus]SJZ32374.1 Glycosyltransferase, GT2 family [Enhydrobacter aerosaccus]